jgi:predicted phage baseplate assembly protein
MPLETFVPVIDDRNFDDIVAEIRARIARYTPEWQPVWSDVNDNDPGITLAQVFAWLSEMLLYRMQRVPELNYIKFLQLIGIELTPAQPATAEISFAVAAGDTRAVVPVPPRTQVSASSDDGPPLVYETVRSLSAVACTLQSVQAYDGAQYRDWTERNQQARDGWAPFGDLPRPGGALTLGFGFPAGHPNESSFPAISLELAVWTAAPPGSVPRVFQCGSDSAYAPAKLQWEGFDGADWVPIDQFEDESLAFTRAGHLLLRVPATAVLARAYLGAYGAVDPVTGAARPMLFWLRARLVTAQYERAPLLLAVRTNTAPVEQAQTVTRELLGGTDGTRGQRWQLENAPVLTGSLRVQIDDGTGARVWQAKDDLLGSGPTDEHVAVDLTSGVIVAGDGENGAIPVANASNPDANVLALTYRYGGGKAGNVAAKAIATLLTPVDGIDDGKVENVFAAVGGRDEERLEEAKKRARQVLRTHDRAVTPDDFEQLARQAGNVRRARALALAHPQFPGVQVPGAITVIVVPDGDGPAPVPSEALLRTVCEYLDKRRLLGTELFVVAPRYVSVSIAAQVVVRDGASAATVRQGVEAALARYLHPLEGGDDGSGWPFAGALRYSKLVQRVFGVADVDSVASLVLTVDGDEWPECRDVAIATIAPLALIEVVGLQIETLSQREAEAMQP